MICSVLKSICDDSSSEQPKGGDPLA